MPWGSVARGLAKPRTWAWVGAGIGAGWALERLAGTGSFVWWGGVAVWFGAGLPLLMAVLVALACVSVVVALAPMAWIARAQGRPSGLRCLSNELRDLAASVLPRYLRALRRVHQWRGWALALGALLWWCTRLALVALGC